MFCNRTAGILAVVFLFIVVRGNVEIDPGITIHPAPSVVIAQKNSPLVLNCSVSSSPDAGPVEYFWHKDGEPVVLGRFLQISTNGSLFFTQVKNNRNSKNRNRNHNGFYECFLKNKYGTVIARQVQLKVARIAKSFTIEPLDQVVFVGGVARFECRIDGIPPPLYVWEKDSSHLPRDGRFVDLNSGILQIHNVTESDAGTYYCSAYQSLNKVNNVRSTIDVVLQRSREAKLSVIRDLNKRPPTIIAIDKEVNAVKDNSVTLECLADGNPPPVVTWMKGKEPTVDGKFRESVGGSNLRFIKVNDKVDAGNYSCVASSPGFPVVKAYTQLNVQVPPYMVEPPVSEGHPVARRFRLKCTVEGTPMPQVTWYKNGTKIESNGRMRMSATNELMIDSSASDSGYYQCIAKNDVGVVMATARLNIIRMDNAPKPPGNLTVTHVTSKIVCMNWLPSEYPTCCPVLAYTVHYTALADVNSFDSKSLTHEKNTCITDLKPFTDYKFYVRAYTTKGAGPPSETVTVRTKESVPEIPPNFRLSSSSPNNIDIKWDEIPIKMQNGVITGYKIYIMTGNQVMQRNQTADSFHYTVTGLQPDTEYKVRVLACTAVGCPVLGEDKWPWQAHRTPKVTSEPTVNVQLAVSQLNLSCVAVRWNLTEEEKLTQGFKIYVSRKVEPIDARVFEVTDTTKRLFVICNLESEKFYEVMFVVDGSSHPLATVVEIFQTVPPDKSPLPPPPVNILARTISSSEILIIWKRPGSQYDIQFYTVEYYRINNPSNIIYARSDTLEHTLTNLHPFTSYSIRVRSHTSTQDHGIFSDPVEIKTMEDVPSAPEKVYIVQTDKDKVTLQWEPPTQKNGVIISYVILYNNEKDVPEKLWQSLEQNGTLTEATISGIKSDANYYFKVGACTKQGPGHFSQTVERKPLICTIQCSRGSEEPNPADEGSGILKDQRLGIIIGCSIGLSSIIICIIVVVARQRHFARMNRNSNSINGNHGNHNVGQYLSNHDEQTSNHVVDEGAPMLEENAHADAKGPDNTIHFPGNGQIIYFCNGKTPNGKIRAYVASPISNGQAGERTALITSRSAGHMTGHMTETPGETTDVTHSHSDGNVQSLPHNNTERGYKSSGNSIDIENSTSKIDKPFWNSQASGAPQGQGHSAGSKNDLKDNSDLISKMLQATTSNLDTSSELPQRSGVKSGDAMEIDLLSVDA